MCSDFLIRILDKVSKLGQSDPLLRGSLTPSVACDTRFGLFKYTWKSWE
jgi:hypothetical protein